MNKIVLTNIFVVLLILFAGCNKDNEQAATNNTVKVKTIKVVEREIGNRVHSSGILAAKQEIKLSFKTGGIINKINVDEGGVVKAGQVLAQLKLTEIEAQVNQAQYNLEKSVRDLQRAKSLFADSVVTLELLENATTAFEIAKSSLKIANFNKQYSTIIAPSNGNILRRLVETNEIVGAGTPVFLFASTKDDWVVRVNLADREVVKIALGDTAFIRFDAFRREKFIALISEIANAADPQTGTYEVELRLLPTQHRLISGFIAKADIFSAIKEKYCIIPVEALVDADEISGYVYAVKNNRAEKVKFEIKKINGQELIISSGLEPGMEIVTIGMSSIKKDSKIEVLK